MSLRVEGLQAGSAAFRAAGNATVFASFERSCYVEAQAGIACVGADIGLGPLNVVAGKDFAVPSTGTAIFLDLDSARAWKPAAPSGIKKIPAGEMPESIREPAQAFLDWIARSGKPDDALIGRGPGLTPAGDDFVGGAMIALRVFGRAQLADRIAAWALPLARERTNRISRAHLECAAAGEGHEALHLFLGSFEEKHLAALGRVGHTSGLDAAAGALLALGVVWHPHGIPSPI